MFYGETHLNTCFLPVIFRSNECWADMIPSKMLISVYNDEEKIIKSKIFIINALFYTLVFKLLFNMIINTTFAVA